MYVCIEFLVACYKFKEKLRTLKYCLKLKKKLKNWKTIRKGIWYFINILWLITNYMGKIYIDNYTNFVRILKSKFKYVLSFFFIKK